MKKPTWAKPGIYGLLTGSVATAFVGFSWGGWMTSSSASEMAVERSRTDVAAALVPVCLQASRADPERIAKLATINEAVAFRRTDAVLATGWATPPGEDTPSRDLAMACVEELGLDAS